MFLGHFAVGLAAKSIEKKPSLGTYFIAVQFLDLLWPTLLLLGLEKVSIQPGGVIPLNFDSYPISHSLLAVVGWGALFATVYYFTQWAARAALVVGLCVVSHWVLDFIVHAPDLPLYPGASPKVGLGLWGSMMSAQLVESILFITGIYLYLNSTRPINKKGIYVIWSLIIFTALIHVSNIFGPPPPSVSAVAWAGHLQWLFVLWAYWADNNRTSGAEAVSA